MENDVYDLCVVGAGMIGSAVAKYASEWGRVCLVGPEEPEERDVNCKRDIFGCHYDEGRIARCLAHDPIWTQLARISMSRYRQIESDSGIGFYDEVGSLVAGGKDTKYMMDNEKVSKEQQLEIEILSYETLKTKFPLLNFSDIDHGIYEVKAGHISARNLVSAQIKLAKSKGCACIHEIVENVTQMEKDGNSNMCVLTESGKQVLTRKVLLATGAFTAFRNLLPVDHELDVGLCPLTTAMIEVTADDFTNMRKYPTLIYFGKGADNWKKDYPRSKDGEYSWYMLPPIKYPDGKYYIKLGHLQHATTKRFTSSCEVKEWYCSGGDTKLVNDTVDLFKSVVQDVNPISYHGDSCVITTTPTKRLYIDTLHHQLGVAVGGNAYAAKSSDEIGRIAAVMMMKNEWDSSLEKTDFNLKMKEKPSN
ncbi:N-methyl-L-tryptophan oxidase-like isoform X2 [Mytilus californianus]|uniref:N-methyl-L-tryptophan oxidase-like isoform X2 n=1 Tax=Mytilus californianus TaxID=6549 RepID=UPI0022472BB2|nr:N-methyl-L-tryptophan oxidase-like isoform X2 [Mytilus californianus]